MTAPDVFVDAERRAALRLVLGPGVMLVTAMLPLLVRLRPPQLAAILESAPRGSPPDERTAAAVLEAVRRAVERVERPIARVMRPSCFTRGISRFLLLRLAGVDVQLMFGAGHQKGRFAAHCWLERGAVPVFETSDPRLEFPVFFRIPRPPSHPA